MDYPLTARRTRHYEWEWIEIPYDWKETGEMPHMLALSDKAVELMAYLSLHDGANMDQILAAVWPTEPPLRSRRLFDNTAVEINRVASEATGDASPVLLTPNAAGPRPISSSGSRVMVNVMRAKPCVEVYGPDERLPGEDIHVWRSRPSQAKSTQRSAVRRATERAGRGAVQRATRENSTTGLPPQAIGEADGVDDDRSAALIAAREQLKEAGAFEERANRPRPESSTRSRKQDASPR